MRTLMDQLAWAVSLLADLPIALYGSCMGAVSALALATTLKEEFAIDVTHLFAASYPLFQLPSQLHRLPDNQFRSEILKLGFVPPEIAADLEIVDFYLPQIRADFELCETYIPSSTVLECPITTLVGASDCLADYSFAGWAPHTRAKWRHVIVPGGHLLSTESTDEVRGTVRDTLLQGIAHTISAYPDSNSAP
jgi:medium-chain acyl-[acyl-carrier-protein] hydrolase